jgi:hypothetical protein
MANVRKQRNFIYSLQSGDSVVMGQREKQEIVYDHYLHHIGTHIPKECALNFFELGWQPMNLQHLGTPFTKNEVKSVVIQAPKENHQAPMALSVCLFSECWEIIKDDILNALEQFYFLNQQGLHFLNHALVGLIPKKRPP